jgi:hypothetical protein
MNATFYSVIASTCLMTSTLVHADCSPILSKQYVNAQWIVDSLRPDKPGQVRVFASDGSEYTAGQVLWMKGQLRSVLQACAQADEATAATALHGVTGLLDSHHAERR